MDKHINSKTKMAKGSRRIHGLVTVLAAGVMMWGCAAASSSPAAKSPVAAQKAPGNMVASLDQRMPSQPSDGSLWDDRGMLGQMFYNPKARQIGDIVTIKIVENASATNKAATTTDRSSSLTAGLSNFFNAEKSFPSDQPFFNPFSSVSGSIDSQFAGNGATQRSGALNAYMTAQVVEVLRNGNLIIEGNREVRVNAENQMITLTGMVRPRDISSENVILSTYIADARITYSGNGVLNDRQKPGWLTRIFDKVWPF